MRAFSLLLFCFPWLTVDAAHWSVYQPGQQVIYGGTYLQLTHTQTSTAAQPTITTGAAHDQKVLTPPPIPNPAIPMQVQIQLPSSGGLQTMSPPVPGAMMGFSIEMSVANQVCESSSLPPPSTLTNPHISGKEQVCTPSHFTTLAIPIPTFDSSLLQVAFLNLMANIVERAGWVQVRVGGNTQDTATLVSFLPNGTVIAKDKNNTFSNPTATPPLEYTVDLLQMMENISKLVGVYWYLGWFSLCHVPTIFEAKSSKVSPGSTIRMSRLRSSQTPRTSLATIYLVSRPEMNQIFTPSTGTGQL